MLHSPNLSCVERVYVRLNQAHWKIARFELFCFPGRSKCFLKAKNSSTFQCNDVKLFLLWANYKKSLSFAVSQLLTVWQNTQGKKVRKGREVGLFLSVITKNGCIVGCCYFWWLLYILRIKTQTKDKNTNLFTTFKKCVQVMESAYVSTWKIV